MLIPSHLAGSVLWNASNSSCASFVTPFPRRFSRSWSLATAAASLAFRARISRVWRAGRAFAKVWGSEVEGERERSVKLEMRLMGRMR
jgi:hypothetical protein